MTEAETTQSSTPAEPPTPPVQEEVLRALPVNADAEAAAALFRRLPKAELHLHIEGTLEPEMLFDMAKRNDVELPYKSVDECRTAYSSFSSLTDFIKFFRLGTTVIKTGDDYFELTEAYLRRAHADNVCHAEIMVEAYTQQKVPYPDMLRGVKRAMTEAEARDGITSALILTLDRSRPEEESLAFIEEAAKLENVVDGVGLASVEKANPPSKFTKAFAAAKKRGWYLVCHAGEEGPPEYIVEALDSLKASRIDHGVSCLADRQLVHRLRAEQTPLTVCPVSNVKLGVAKSLKEHPLGAMLKAGLNCSFNSDDPAYFDGKYMNDAFAAWCAENPRVTPDDARRLAANSVRSAVMTDRVRQEEILKTIMSMK